MHDGEPCRPNQLLIAATFGKHTSRMASWRGTTTSLRGCVSDLGPRAPLCGGPSGTADASGSNYPTAAAQTVTSSDWVEVKGSFTPAITGTLTAANVSVSGAPVGVDIYLDDVTITATKL